MSADIAQFLRVRTCPVGAAGFPQMDFSAELPVWLWDGRICRWPIVSEKADDLPTRMA
jgi:hypothetical protein